MGLLVCSAAFALPECEGTYSKKWTNCQGTYLDINGVEYVGEFKDGKEHGQGTYTWADGDEYVGEWKDGKRHGQGTDTNAHGNKYVGEYKDGKPNGQGTYTYADGRIDNGIWNKGELVKRNKIQTQITIKEPTILTKSEKKEKDKYLKEIEKDLWLNETQGDYRRSKMEPKIIINDQGLWLIRYKGHTNMMGAVFKSNYYVMTVNNRVVVLYTFCDGRSCKNIDQKVAKILAPSFKIDSKKQSFNLDDKEDMMNMIGTIRDGYRYYKLAKFLLLLL